MHSSLNTLAEQVIDACVADKRDVRREEYSRLAKNLDFDSLGDFRRAIAAQAFARLRGTKQANATEQRSIAYMAGYVLDAAARGEDHEYAAQQMLDKFRLTRGEHAAFLNRLDQELIARIINV